MVNNPLVELDELKRFSRKQIREYAGISQYKCHVLVADLVKADLLLKSGKGENGGFLYTINCDNEELNNPEKALGLISVDEIKAKLAERKL